MSMTLTSEGTARRGKEGESNQLLAEGLGSFTFVEASVPFTSTKDKALRLADIRSHATRIYHLRRKQRQHISQQWPFSDVHGGHETADTTKTGDIATQERNPLSHRNEPRESNIQSFFAAPRTRERGESLISQPCCFCIDSGIRRPCHHQARRKKINIGADHDQAEKFLPKLRKVFHETPYPVDTVVVDALQHYTSLATSLQWPHDVPVQPSPAPDLFRLILHDDLPLTAFSALTTVFRTAAISNPGNGMIILREKTRAIGLLRRRLSSQQLNADVMILTILLVMTFDFLVPIQTARELPWETHFYAIEQLSRLGLREVSLDTRDDIMRRVHTYKEYYDWTKAQALLENTEGCGLPSSGWYAIRSEERPVSIPIGFEYLVRTTRIQPAVVRLIMQVNDLTTMSREPKHGMALHHCLRETRCLAMDLFRPRQNLDDFESVLAMALCCLCQYLRIKMSDLTGSDPQGLRIAGLRCMFPRQEYSLPGCVDLTDPGIRNAAIWAATVILTLTSPNFPRWATMSAWKLLSLCEGDKPLSWDHKFDMCKREFFWPEAWLVPERISCVSWSAL